MIKFRDLEPFQVKVVAKVKSRICSGKEVARKAVLDFI